jgi:hypothetical protein
VALGARDRERLEELVLERLVIFEPALLELLRRHARELELELLADHDGLLEAHAVQLAQLARAHLEPVGEVSERLGGLHRDAIAVHGVVRGIGRAPGTSVTAEGASSEAGGGRASAIAAGGSRARARGGRGGRRSRARGGAAAGGGSGAGRSAVTVG